MKQRFFRHGRSVRTMNNPKKFVRNDIDKKKGSSFGLAQAFGCALRGVAYVVSTQRNVKIYGIVIAVALILGIVLRIDAQSWLAVVFCIVLVLAAECINTAIESVVDLVSPEYADLAKLAKDCAAGAVFVCAAGSLVVAAIVYIPFILQAVGLR